MAMERRNKNHCNPVGRYCIGHLDTDHYSHFDQSLYYHDDDEADDKKDASNHYCHDCDDDDDDA